MMAICFDWKEIDSLENYINSNKNENCFHYNVENDVVQSGEGLDFVMSAA